MNDSQILQGLAKALAPLMDPKFKVTGLPSGTPSNLFYTGPAGLFGVLGLERDIISTRVQPYGITSIIPVRGSITMLPQFPYLTGFLPASGSQPATPCDDGPTAGSGKNCLQTAVFGRYTMQTREMDITRQGQIINRGEFTDLTYLNDPIAQQLGGVFEQQFALGRQDANILGAEQLMRFVEVGVAFQNLLAPQVYVANPDNNNAGGGYKEFVGLDILISTGKKDALTGTSCPSLDSDVKDFNYGRVDNTNLNPDIVNVVTYMMRFLKHNANSMNFGEVRWVIAMREELFYELSAVWPCSYMTYRCAFRTSDGTVVQNVSATDQIAMRDAMRNGRYLIVDGIQYDVVFDPAIDEQTSADTNKLAATTFASNIYIIPMTVQGGTFQSFYFEYYDYSRTALPAAQQGRYSEWYWTDGGRFLWHNKPPTNWCVQHIARIEPRLVLRTPQLAGKILNVAYKPLQHTRDAFPTDPYFVNGGISTGRPAPSLIVK